MHLHLGIIYPPVAVISNDRHIVRIKVIQHDFFVGGEITTSAGFVDVAFAMAGVIFMVVFVVVFVEVFMVVFVVIVVIVFVVVFGDRGDVVVFVVVLVTCC